MIFPFHFSLDPGLGSPEEEQHEPVGLGSERNHKNGQNVGATFLGRKAEIVVVAQPGEEKALGKHYCF